MSNWFKYFLLIATGFLILFICSLFQNSVMPQKGEYYYSEFLRNNYTISAAVVFFIAGIPAGYFLKLNPWLTGICLILIFPVTSLYEATVYKGSHNLIPFEFVIHFLYALPGIIGAYAGGLLFKRYSK